MALRFRRSIRLAPGLRLNFGKRGVSLSAGVRGVSVTFGGRGTYANVGLPGTGLSVRGRISGPSARHGHASAPRQSPGGPIRSETVSINVKLKDNGTVLFDDAADQPLPANLDRRPSKNRVRAETLPRKWLKLIAVSGYRRQGSSQLYFFDIKYNWIWSAYTCVQFVLHRHECY